jgi:predicted O-linked N-acetylglucosamine transferase (SPINDLY family)
MRLNGDQAAGAVMDQMTSHADQLAIAYGHHVSGRLSRAEVLYRAILEAEPDNSDALQLLALLMAQTERPAIAADLFRDAVALRPELANLHYNLANASREIGRPADAAAACRRALALRPDFVEARVTLSDVLLQLRQFDEAIEQCRRALASRPDIAEAHNNLGNALRAKGEPRDALAAYRRAAELKPEFAEAHNNLGAVLQEQGRVPAAIACYERALALRPDYPDALVNLGNALWLRQRPGEAVTCYQRAVALRPEDPLMRAYLAHPKAMMCAWDEREAEEAAVTSAMRAHPGEVPPYNLLTQRSTPAEQLLCARGMARRLSDGRSLIFQNHRLARGGRIRLGYISADLREHPVGWAAAGLLEAHDRARFATHAYAYGPDDSGATRTRIATGCERFTDLSALGDEAAARRIHADGIDVLVDLTGYTLHARPGIMAFRPAPVQVSFLGYVGTMGADFIDAIIVDRFVVPNDQQVYYTERLVPVPCWWPATIPRPVSLHTPSRNECGLPDGFVFACFNNSHKIKPEMFDVWMRLLHAVPDSALWLVEFNPAVANNLRREAAWRGVTPERLVFGTNAPTDAYLSRLRCADLFLDTLPYNACTTAYDALHAGLPVLTCAGSTFAGRTAGSMLHAVGLPELVTTSLAEYEQRAVQFARDPSYLAGIRARLTRARTLSALFDTTRAAHDLESAFIGLLDAWCDA